MLFHIAVQHAYRLLLAHEMLARLPADVFDDEEHNAKHHEYEERKQRLSTIIITKMPMTVSPLEMR